MRIAITGASGFIGQQLIPFFATRGHETVALVRDRTRTGIFWDPESQQIDAQSLNGIDAVIHLAGESVAERWTADKKARIYNSRIKGTRLLAQTLANLQQPPKDLLCASAIGYYGERGNEILTEESTAGNSFLGRVCVEWESSAEPAAASGIRTSNLRFGIVLSTTGGAFPKMLKPFEIGAGGRLGTGKQYMSWIMLEDSLNAIEFVLQKRQLAGPLNIVAPGPVTNLEFTETLARVLGRPAIIPVPATMAYLAYGNEMADEVLLASDRVVPERLSAAGFCYKFSKLEAALHHAITNRA